MVKFVPTKIYGSANLPLTFRLKRSGNRRITTISVKHVQFTCAVAYISVKLFILKTFVMDSISFIINSKYDDLRKEVSDRTLISLL